MPIITGIYFGSAGIFVRKLSGNMNNTTIVASRLIVAVLLLGIWLAYSHPEYFKIHLKDCWIFIGAGLLGSLGVNVCYNFAINELSLSLAAVLLALSPIVVMIVAFFLFHEAITRRKVLSIFLAICGCVLTSGIFETNESMHWSWIIPGFTRNIYPRILQPSWKITGSEITCPGTGFPITFHSVFTSEIPSATCFFQRKTSCFSFLKKPEKRACR